jgi:ketosteroid isomerase-like protein
VTTPRQAADGLLAAVVGARVDDIVDSYLPSPSTYVFVEGPRWSTLGAEAVAQGWRAWADAGIRITRTHWVEGPFEQASADLAWVAGILEVAVEAGGDARTMRLRGSYVLARSDQRWRIVHEHFSQPVADPYGTGDWL